MTAIAQAHPTTAPSLAPTVHRRAAVWAGLWLRDARARVLLSRPSAD